MLGFQESQCGSGFSFPHSIQLFQLWSSGVRSCECQSLARIWQKEIEIYIRVLYCSPVFGVMYLVNLVKAFEALLIALQLPCKGLYEVTKCSLKGYIRIGGARLCRCLYVGGERKRACLTIITLRKDWTTMKIALPCLDQTWGFQTFSAGHIHRVWRRIRFWCQKLQNPSGKQKKIDFRIRYFLLLNPFIGLYSP